MQRIRIVLVELPHILRGIVRAVLDDQPDMEVVEDRVGYDGLQQTLASTSAQLVISGWDGHVDDLAEPAVAHLHLLREHPGVRILAVREDGRRGCLWELRPQRTPLGELSPERLVEAIRRAFR